MKVQLKKEAAMLAELNKVIDILKASPVTIGAKIGTSGKIFGSVTSLQITRAIRDQKGYEIDRKRISIVDEVKEAGTHKASIDFGNGNTVEIDFESCCRVIYAKQYLKSLFPGTGFFVFRLQPFVASPLVSLTCTFRFHGITFHENGLWKKTLSKERCWAFDKAQPHICLIVYLLPGFRLRSL